MIRWEPYKRENIFNPYPMYQWLRENDPVHKSLNGDYIITKYADVKQILDNKNCLTGARMNWLKANENTISDQLDVNFESLNIVMSAFPLFLNNRKHDRIKRFMYAVWEMKDYSELVKKNIDQLLGELNKKIEFDFISSFSNKLSLFTITSILGIDQKHSEQLIKETKKFFAIMDVYLSTRHLQEIIESAEVLISMLEQIINEKKQKPDDSLISAILEKNKSENYPLSKSEVLSICLSFLAGGKETTSGLIGNVMLHFADNLRWQNHLKANPDDQVSYINEVIRYDPPAQLSVRTNSKQLELNDHIIPPNSTIIISMASANRDKDLLPNGEEFNIKNQMRHLSFGSGAHYCMGDWLGKLQAQMALEHFSKNYSKITCVSEPKYNNNLTIRTLSELVLKAES